jgi:CelD/BcsL family acetyltransferase involved in cellulose biosynthesis
MYDAGVHSRSTRSRTLSGKLQSSLPSSRPPIEPYAHYSVEPVTTEAALRGLEENWNTLSKTADEPNVFATFDWFRAWNQRATELDLKQHRRPNVLALKMGSAVAGISPLICRTVSRFGLAVRKVEFLESPADYNDLLLGNDAARQIKSVIDYLEQTQEEWDIVDLRSTRDVGNTITLVEEALSSSNLIHRILPEARCPYLVIDTDAIGIVGRLSRSVRRTLRNQQNRLDRMSSEGLRVRIIEHPEDEPGLLNKFIALEGQKRVQGERIPPLFARDPQVFQSLFDSLGPRGWLYAALMELGDRAVAFQLGFRCGNALWDFSKAYDSTFSYLSPGTMLVPAILDYGFLHGYREYDFLRGEEQYKTRWSTDFHGTSRVIIWNQRWMSRLRAFIYLDLKAAISSAVRYSGSE